MSISQQKGCQVPRVKRCEPKGPASPGAVPKASGMPQVTLQGAVGSIKDSLPGSGTTGTSQL